MLLSADKTIKTMTTSSSPTSTMQNNQLPDNLLQLQNLVKFTDISAKTRDFQAVAGQEEKGIDKLVMF
jgi:hypothetical protein